MGKIKHYIAKFLKGFTMKDKGAVTQERSELSRIVQDLICRFPPGRLYILKSVTSAMCICKIQGYSKNGTLSVVVERKTNSVRQDIYLEDLPPEEIGICSIDLNEILQRRADNVLAQIAHDVWENDGNPQKYTT